jgi:hypothetical protein
VIIATLETAIKARKIATGASSGVTGVGSIIAKGFFS